MLQLRGPGLGLPWCSQAAVGQQCVPDGTIPPCSQAPVGAQCVPDGGSSPPSTITVPGASPPGGGGGTWYVQQSLPTNPAPTNILLPGGSPPTPQPTPTTGTITNVTPGTVATVTGAMPAGFQVSQLWTTWWGLGLLALGGYAAYRYSKKPSKAA